MKTSKIKIRIRKDQKALYEVKKYIKQTIKMNKDYAEYKNLDYHAERITQLNNALKVIEEFEKVYETMYKLERIEKRMIALEDIFDEDTGEKTDN